MKITAKATDANDIFVDVSVTAATIIRIFAAVNDICSYRNVYKNVVYIYCFGGYFH